ncbi:hypothetical protein ABZV80_00895 [Streptomyces sp. NPDC005132]|uniref:hypothetical protein n=1 Tax=Streptomyces sp. NPDC005132 TaxID=3154294 RepID=UPI0033A4C77D
MRSVRQADKNDANRTSVRSGIDALAALAVIGLASGCAGGEAAEPRPAHGLRMTGL